jgi:hypothetical protein
VTTSAYLRASNQPPPLEGYDLFSQDRPLAEALKNPPTPRAFDRFGETRLENLFGPTPCRSIRYCG